MSEIAKIRPFYIGHFLDNGGYCDAATNYLEALESCGVEVVAAPFVLNNPKTDVSEVLNRSMKRKLDDVNIVILHSLPKFFDRDPTLPTVGIFSTEMSGIPQDWVESINKLDCAIVSSAQSRKACEDSGVIIPIEVVPYAFNIEKYERGYDKTPFIQRLKDEGKTIFYSIGEFVNRKNYSSLLRAYYTEFTNKDKVHLVIKSSLNGRSPEQLAQIFSMKNNEIFRGLNLPESQMPEVDFLPQNMNIEEICSLHYTCDIFVQCSYGESWSLPAFDAMAFGKTPIVPASSGYFEYMDQSTGFLTKVSQSPCFGLIDADPNIYNSSFDYYPVDINDLKSKMRFCLSNKDKLKEKVIAGIEKAKLFNYEAVGSQLRKVLENVKEKFRLRMGQRRELEGYSG